MKNKILKFPDGFMWGAATSSHQVEGGNHNDWSEWEKSELRITNYELRMKKKFDPENLISGQACDSYNRWREDLDLVQSLNCNAYRFSLEWSRIEPEEGRWNEEEIEHYREILKEMRKRGIKSFVTLWHWTNPTWMTEYGSWENKRVVENFKKFAEKIVLELGDYIDFWTPLNEPLMHIAHGYISGKFPPNKKRNIFGSLKVFNNLVSAHKTAYNIIHKKYPQAQVGVAMTNGYFSAAHKYNPIEFAIVKIAHYFRNDWYINNIKGYYDYLGVNYYHHDRIVWYPPFKKNLNEKITDFGWEIYPEGIYHVLKNYVKYKKPIYILENGIADAEDKQRAEFIIDHLKFVRQAIEDGTDVCGYFYWSLLDNFEWADGFEMKFGLYEVDRKTFERKPRLSAGVYAEICKNNEFNV